MIDWVSSSADLNLLFDLVISLVSLPQSELQIVFNNDRLWKSFSTNGEVVHTHDRVVIRVQKSWLLGDVLHFVILNVKHAFWQKFLIHRILHDIDSQMVGRRGLGDGLVYFFGVFSSWFCFNGLWFMNRNCDLLLEYDLVGEESDPVLEVWHDAVCRTPASLAVGFVGVRSWNLLGLTTTSNLRHLLRGLVVES